MRSPHTHRARSIVVFYGGNTVDTPNGGYTLNVVKPDEERLPFAALFSLRHHQLHCCSASIETKQRSGRPFLQHMHDKTLPSPLEAG